MGRPIKRKFIGTTVGGASLAGGEGISSIAYTNRGTRYSAGITVTSAVSPIGGIRAVITPVTVFANGAINTATIDTAGTGYTTAPVLTITKPGNVTVTGTNDAFWQDGSNLRLSSTTGLFVGMYSNVAGKSTVYIATIYSDGNIRGSNTYGNVSSGTPIAFGDTGASGSLTAVLAAAVTTGNTIQANAWTTTSGIGQQADIVAQKGSRRYRVTNATETDVVRLIKSTECGAANTAGGPPAAGLMTITATDSTGGTYWVTKIDSRTATITPGGTGPGSQFSANAQAIWSMNAAVVNTTVKLATND